MPRTGVHFCMTSTAFQHGLLDISGLCQLSYNIYVLLACIPRGQLCGNRCVVPPRAGSSDEPETIRGLAVNPPLETLELDPGTHAAQSSL